MVIHIPPAAKDLQPPLEAEWYPVKGRVNRRLQLPAHCQPRELADKQEKKKITI